MSSKQSTSSDNIDRSFDNETERLMIRILEREDLEPARLLHNEHSTLLMLTDVEHVSQAQQESWFQSVSLSKTSRRYAIREKSSRDFVGVFRVDHLDLKNRSVMIGLDIVPRHRGKGYAPEVYNWFLAYFFRQLGMHRVSLKVLDDNGRARRLYERLGFREEGRERDALFREGRFHDYICMSVLESEYRERAGV